MDLKDLLHRHAGRTAWIIGTGPSLSDLDPAAIDADAGPRILIHRAGFVVPHRVGRTYWLVLDDGWGLSVPGPWWPMLTLIRDAPPGQAPLVGVFRNPLLGRTRRPPAPAGNNIVHFGVMKSPRREEALAMTPGECAAAGELFERIGSAATAIHLAWLMGCMRVRLVGIDGGTGISPALAGLYPAGGTDHDTARKYALAAARRLGVELV